MKTPILDFIHQYKDSGVTRLHMPGHKGRSFLGFEPYDITEVKGADALYEAEGIIEESEKNATELFGSRRTLYSTEGSSQCIRGMLYLMLVHYRQRGKEIAQAVATKGDTSYNNITKRPKIIAARNVHKAFVFAATLLDFDIQWLWPEEKADSICSCKITPWQVEEALKEQEDTVAGVYVTSPDYLGGQCDIKAIAEVCHRYGTVLAVDNAHGAYLHFIQNQEYLHPLEAGADICCDSAHKTLPVLTGGAYLHIGKNAPDCFTKQAKYAMALFGSTSPSYLILASLDHCNQYLSQGYRERLEKTIEEVGRCKKALEEKGWRLSKADPLKITIEMPKGFSSEEKAEELRTNCFRGIECEYADPDYLVFMVTPENDQKDLEHLVRVMGICPMAYQPKKSLPLAKAEQVMSIREAMFEDFEEVTVEEAQGRICRVPAVSCPPAIPIVVPGERIGAEAIKLFHYYGMETLDVVKE